jgi:hypothetical protein
MRSRIGSKHAWIKRKAAITITIQMKNITKYPYRSFSSEDMVEDLNTIAFDSKMISSIMHRLAGEKNQHGFGNQKFLPD